MTTVTSANDGIEQLRPELFDLIWQETSALRREAHAGSGCPTKHPPYGTADPQGRGVHDACVSDSCLDLVHDVYERVAPRLGDRLVRFRDTGGLRDASRYAHTAVLSAVADLGRKWRHSRGLPAKPTRSDGVAARVVAAMNSAAPDVMSAEWDEKLFRMIRGYVCKPSASVRSWPLDAWTCDKVEFDGRQRSVGSDAARAEITADISFVLEIAQRVAGRGWVYDNITGPLRRSANPQSLDDLDDAGALPPVVSHDDAATADLVRGEYASLCAKGVDAAKAANEALAYGYGLDVPAARCADEAVVDWLERRVPSATSGRI